MFVFLVEKCNVLHPGSPELVVRTVDHIVTAVAKFVQRNARRALISEDDRQRGETRLWLQILEIFLKHITAVLFVGRQSLPQVSVVLQLRRQPPQ